VQAPPKQEPGHFHAVRFYKDSESLCRIVGSFLKEGFTESQPAIVIATAPHQRMIAKCLEADGLDVDKLKAAGQLVVYDAHIVLSQFMTDGMPNAARFKSAVGPLLRKACKGKADCVVRAYGEMVDVLWKKGQTAAATRLEMFWNKLAQTESFSLLCGYAMGSFYKDGAIEDICSHHSHVLSDPPGSVDAPAVQH
jgi:hypothetical protein